MSIFRVRDRGFTLVEIIVVVAVIGILAAVVVASFSSARTKARDTQRMSDIEQIRLALRLYKDAAGVYPDCASGMVIGEAAATPVGCTDSIDTALTSHFAQIPKDPNGSGSDTTYEYWYDSSLNCIAGGSAEKVLYIKNTERPSNDNWSTVCNVPGTEPGTYTHVIILQ